MIDLRQRIVCVGLNYGDNVRSRSSSCELYIPSRNQVPALVPLLRAVTRRAASEEHGASKHFQRLGTGELFGLMDSRERVVYETVVD